jgi:hypothetical protein
MSLPRAHPPGDAVQWLLWGLVILLAVALIVAIAQRIRLPLHPDRAERAPLAAACDLGAGPCSTTFADGGRVTLDIQPRGIPPVQPLTIAVTLDDLPPPTRVELDLVGVDMDMGFNRIALAPAAGDGAGGTGSTPDPGSAPGTGAARGARRWEGNGMLPVCISRRMTWEARVLLHRPSGLSVAPFRFESIRPR